MNVPVTLHPRLVEESVWASVAARRGAGGFHREREALYAEVDPEARERRFARFYSSWFDRLGLAEPVATALQEQARALAPVRRILLLSTASHRREGAEMFVADSGERSVVVAVKPATLIDPGACRTLLRRELLHVADMLDPAFAYEPRLTASDVGPADDRRVRERYRILWNCTVDGRLVQLGRLDPAVRDERRHEFGAAFSVLGEATGACFARLFDGPRPTHPDFVRIATSPETGFGLRPALASSPRRCPLCAFPTDALEPDPAGLPAGALRGIASDFPFWRPELGLCPQCADLYRSRLLFECPAR